MSRKHRPHWCEDDQFNFNVKFGEGLNPSSQNSFWPFKGLQPFETMMVCPENDFVAEQVMTEVCKADMTAKSSRRVVQ